MFDENDHVACAILIKESGSKTWNLHCFTLRKSVAWRTASFLREGTKDNYLVVLREDYDNGKLKPLKSPAGFELGDNVEIYDDPQPFDPVIVPEAWKVNKAIVKAKEPESEKTVKSSLNKDEVKINKYNELAVMSGQIEKLGKQMLDLDI